MSTANLPAPSTSRRTGALLALALAASAAAALLAFLLVVAPAAAARGSAVVWTAPTKADRTSFRVALGGTLDVTLRAQASGPVEELSIEPVRGLPAGASITTTSEGNRVTAVFRWKPVAEASFTIEFVARDGRGASTPARTYTIAAYRKVSYPQRYGLTNRNVGHWAPVLRSTVARAAPRPSARAVAKLNVLTPEHTQNVVLVLEGIDRSASDTWYRVRLPILPNNSTGWVRKHDLGELTKVTTRIFIDRAKLRLTVARDGRTIFKAPIGVGEPQWPTPPGEFYVRSRITNFGSPIYGVLAFGTNARSPVLTDWPGGGFVGIHGTNQPELLPGRVSHGCVRMRNADIVRLARLIKIGTPVTIR